MRKLKSLLLIAFLAFGATGIANAQKIGHVNLDRVIANMPETRTMQAEIAKITKTYKDDIDGEKKKLDDKIKKYTAEQNSQTEDVNKLRLQEVQGENAKISRAEQAAIQDINEKQQRMLIPILQKAEKALKEVAKDKGLAYILDASAGKGVLISDNGIDVYDDLKAKLGLLPDQKPQTPEEKK